ncbi:hypothetical protein [Comamonas sp. J-3]|uniref:hypothetical protein n=1 Tax=Comamonas trifloxystrobinivorans TaxID=3350256 RepID=UPI00372D375B
MIYTHVAAGIVAAALAAWGTWQVQDWRLSGQVEQAQEQKAQAERALVLEQQDRKDQLLRARASALETYTRMEAQKNAAIDKQTQRAEANRLAAQQLRTDVDGLHGQLATVPARIAAATSAAVADYAATATKLFGQCTREYAAMAERADGHANDVQALIEAWPENPSQPAAGNTTKDHHGRQPN